MVRHGLFSSLFCFFIMYSTTQLIQTDPGLYGIITSWRKHLYSSARTLTHFLVPWSPLKIWQIIDNINHGYLICAHGSHIVFTNNECISMFIICDLEFKDNLSFSADQRRALWCPVVKDLSQKIFQLFWTKNLSQTPSVCKLLYAPLYASLVVLYKVT